MTPRVVNKDEKKQRIALAAIGIFSQYGFDKTRMDDIAKAAGVGKGTLYEYYPTKQALLEGAFDLLISGFMESVRATVGRDRSPAENLRVVARSTSRGMEELSSSYRFFIEYMLHTSRDTLHGPVLRGMLAEFRDEVSLLFKAGVADGSFRSDLEPEVAAATFAAWFDGALLHWMVAPEGPTLQEMSDQYIDLILNGICLGKGPVAD